MQNPPTIMLEPNRRVTTTQLHDCLHAVSVLVGCLRMATGTADGEISGGGMPSTSIPALDGEVRAALELSLISASERVEKIFKNEVQWELPDRDMHTLGVKLLEQQVLMQQQSIRSTELQLRALEWRLEAENKAFTEALAATLGKEFQERLDILNGKVPPEDRVVEPLQQQPSQTA